MRILWMGEDTSLDVPIGNNLIRRQPELKGDCLHSSSIKRTVKDDPGFFKEYDVIAYWGGIANHGILSTVKRVKEATDAKIITLLRATGTGIPSWHVDHQIEIIRTLPLFDVIFTPHRDHIEYCKSLNENTHYLPHAIDFSAYPSRRFRYITEDAVITIGTGGMEAHRGFFWSALIYKKLKEEYPGVTGICILPEREAKTTTKFVSEIGLTDVTISTVHGFKDYINMLANETDLALINVMTWGASRTVLDCAVLNIPVIKGGNLNQDDPFLTSTLHCYSDVLDACSIFKTFIEDPEYYLACITETQNTIRKFDVRIVVELFKSYMEEVLTR